MNRPCQGPRTVVENRGSALRQQRAHVMVVLGSVAGVTAQPIGYSGLNQFLGECEVGVGIYQLGKAGRRRRSRGWGDLSRCVGNRDQVHAAPADVTPPLCLARLRGPSWNTGSSFYQ